MTNRSVSSAQRQKAAFASKIDGCDLQAMPGTDDHQRIVCEPPDGLQHRRASEIEQFLQLLHRHEAPRLQLAIDQHLLDALVGHIDLIDQAARARRPLGRGAPFVGHELRTPLRTIHHLASLPSHAPAAAAESGFVSPGVRLVGVRCRMFVPKKIARGC
jgi:hypothetical protein